MGALADRVLLNVANRRRLGANVSRAVIGIERSGSMEAKPQIVIAVTDPDGEIENSRTITRPVVRALGTPEAVALQEVNVTLDGVTYTLVGAQRSGPDLALTFDHRGAHDMALADTPMTASRSTVTRTEFIRRQVMEAGRGKARRRLAFWAYRPGLEMPVAKFERGRSKHAEPGREVGSRMKAADAAKGIKLRGSPTPVGPDQRRHMATAMRVAREGKWPAKATLALAMACIVEPPDFTNPTGGDSTSSGILQLLAATAAGLNVDARNVEAVCRLFGTTGFWGKGGAIKLARENPGKSAGWIAQQVQGSAHPDRYQAVKGDAEKVVGAFDAEGTKGTGTASYVKPYRFKRKRGQSAWASTEELAAEVGRRRFVTIPAPGSDLFVYAADEDLLRLKPQATIRLDAPYVVSRPDYELHTRSPIGQMTVAVIGSAFDSDFAVGLPVRIPDGGAAAGKWLVWDTKETDGSEVVELTLRQPQATKPEPAPEVVQRTDSSSPNASTATTDPESVGAKVYRYAEQMTARNVPYGPAGHTGSWATAERAASQDCSSSTSLALHAAGVLDTPGPQVSAYFLSYGKAGKGEEVTVWSHPGAGPNGHVYIELNVPGKRAAVFDTSREAGGPSGARLRFGSRSTAGMTARHPG